MGRDNHGRKGSNKSVFLSWVRFLSKYGKSFQSVKRIKDARNRLALLNIKIAKQDPVSETYLSASAAFDEAMLYLNAAKHSTSRAMVRGGNQHIKLASDQLTACEEMLGKMEKSIDSTASLQIQRVKPDPSHGAEIQFFHDAPVVPEINPIIVLQGSDYEMGYQYAQQVIEIFGAWLMERKAGVTFSEEELQCLREWEKQLEQYAPEIIALCHGWADGATEAGVPMRYYDALDIWTGHKPPAEEYYGAKDGPPDSIYPPACSGLAAWGSATADGKLVAGASGDHDCSFMATIVAYPQTGNSFIYTPFSAIGQLPNIGPVYMMGHPGMNSKGVAYVHHGGAPKMVEPKAQWGYGIRLGASVFHNLRFANSAKEALKMDLAYPVGDVGERSGVGTAGGFYADATFGYVAESRGDPMIIREAGMAGETDFLYANNSAIHKDAAAAGWMKGNEANWTWSADGGWKPTRMRNNQGAKATGITAQIQSAMAYVYLTSFGRNEFAHRALRGNLGHIDLEYMKSIYRTSATVPQGAWPDITREYNLSGRWDGTYSVGHASNACVAVMQPDSGSEGRYAFCVGTAARGVAPISPTMCTPIYHETNAFWELKLDTSPKAMADAALKTAQQYIARADNALAQTGLAEGHAYRQLLATARQEAENGELLLTRASAVAEARAVSTISKAVRLLTRAQVHALQVLQAIQPPATMPAGIRSASET